MTFRDKMWGTVKTSDTDMNMTLVGTDAQQTLIAIEEADEDKPHSAG